MGFELAVPTSDSNLGSIFARKVMRVTASVPLKISINSGITLSMLSRTRII